ncbi:MAG: hypothetical protein RMI85_04475 [Candidatus Korarchaeum sp.]|nr:hypothetical protein [Candidatus Korarchaeum sp.]
MNESLPYGLEPIDLSGGRVLANFTVDGYTYSNVPSNFTHTSGSRRSVIWHLSKLEIPSGATLRVRFRVHADCSFQDSSEIVNLTHIDCYNREYRLIRSFQMRRLEPDLSRSYMELISPLEPPDRYDEVTWRIRVINNGTGNLYFLTVEDHLNPSYTYLSADPEPNLTGAVVRWSFNWASDPLPPGGEREITLRARLTGCNDPAWNNVSFYWGCNGIACSKSSWSNTSLSRALPELSAAYSSPAHRICGETILSFRVLNLNASFFGFNRSMPLLLRYKMPLGSDKLNCMDYVRGSTNVTLPNGTILRVEPEVLTSGGEKYLEWRLWSIELRDGEHLDVSFKVLTSCCFVVGEEARVTVSGYDACGLNHSCKASDTTEGTLTPSLTVVKSPESQEASIWIPARWNITLSNVGNSTAYNINLTDLLEGLTHVSDNQTGLRVQLSDRRIVWIIPKLEPGESFAVNLAANASRCVNLTNRVIASFGCLGLTCDIASDSSEVLLENITYPNVSISKRPTAGNCPVIAETGDLIEFKISLNNTGGDHGPAYNLTVVDFLPPFLSFVNASDGGTYSLGKVTWRIDRLMNVSKTLTLVVRVREGTRNGTTGTNSVLLRYSDLCGNLANPNSGVAYLSFDSCNMTVIAPPRGKELTLTVTPSTPTPRPTETISRPEGSLIETPPSTSEVPQPNATTGDGRTWSSVLRVFKFPNSTSLEPCEPVVFTVIVDNRGNTTLHRINVSDHMGEMEYLGTFGTHEPNATDHGTLEYGPFELQPGESLELSFMARFNCSGMTRSLTNSVEASGISNLSKLIRAKHEVTLWVREPDIIISSSVHPYATSVGGVIGFEVELLNGGEGTAHDLTLRGPIPESSSYIPGSGVLNGSKWEPEIREGTLIWRTNSDLRPGEKLKLGFKLKVSKPGLNCNEVIVTYDTRCGSPCGIEKAEVCFLVLNPISLWTSAPLFALMLLFSVGRRPAVVDYNFLKWIQTSSRLENLYHAAFRKLYITRRTYIRSMEDPELSKQLGVLMSRGLIEVRDPGARQDLLVISREIEEIYGLDPEESDTIVLGAYMNSPLLLGRRESRIVASRLSLRVMGPIGLHNKMLKERTISGRFFEAVYRDMLERGYKPGVEG